MLFMDLDDFKIINDSLGHEVGDRLIEAVAERLRGCLRPEETLARFGGDEFIALLEDVENPGDAVLVAERIEEGLREPFAVEEKIFVVTASIGIALSTTRTKRPEELLRNADVAMYRAKEKGTPKYALFDTKMHESVLMRLELENDLRRALENREFSLHYQPEIRIGEADKIVEVEALLRWKHPRRGLMLPEQFIPLAEETGLIVPIGRWIIKEACRQGKEWQERYPSEPPLAVCVNVSAEEIRSKDFVQGVKAALRESGLGACGLVLEITEGALFEDTERIKPVLDEIHTLGVRLAIDDFGKEYSSLSRLKRLPFDFLKIDKAFVMSLGTDPTDMTIVETIISLGHALGLEVVGEGVETSGQLECLRNMGCDIAQGNHLARPLPSGEAESVLTNHQIYS